MIRRFLISAGVAAALFPLSIPAFAADMGCLDIRLLCSGFEPNWQFTLEGPAMTFIDPENPEWETNPLQLAACATSVAQGETHVAAGAPLDLDARVVEEECTQPNDEVWPYSVEATFNQGAPATIGRITGTGCCRVPE